LILSCFPVHFVDRKLSADQDLCANLRNLQSKMSVVETFEWSRSSSIGRDIRVSPKSDMIILMRIRIGTNIVAALDFLIWLSCMKIDISVNSFASLSLHRRPCKFKMDLFYGSP
jgi:hypothetical protein